MKAYPDDARNVGYQFDIANILEKKEIWLPLESVLQLMLKAPEGKLLNNLSSWLVHKYGEIAKKLDKSVLKHWKSTLKVYEGMDEELQGDKFIRIIVEEIKYDLAIDATRDYYDLKSLVLVLVVQTRTQSRKS